MNPFIVFSWAYFGLLAQAHEAAAAEFRRFEAALDQIAGDAWTEGRRAMPQPRRRVVLGDENVVPFPRRGT